MKKHRKKTFLSFISIVLSTAVLALALTFLVGCGNVDTESSDFSQKTVSEIEKEMKTIYINGEPYIERDGVFSVLVIGVDATGKVKPNIDQSNNKKSDFLALVIFDDNSKTYKILHINRDTMTNVDVLDIYGRKTNVTRYTQIAQAHTFGDGTHISCKNTVDAVAGLLYGVRINSYISLTMDAVAAINDKVGGVSVEIKEDMTAVDPTFVQGATVKLSGAQALSYVRARGELDDSTNIARMERQKQYMSSLIDTLGGMNPDKSFFLGVFDAIADYSVSNLNSSLLNNLSRYFGEYEFGGAISPKGESAVVNKYMQFTVDDEDIVRIVKELFYDRIEEPSAD